MRNIFIIVIFGLVAGCAGSLDRENSPSTKTGPECSAWKTLVVEDGRYYCVDDELLEERDW